MAAAAARARRIVRFGIGERASSGGRMDEVNVNAERIVFLLHLLLDCPPSCGFVFRRSSS